MSTVPVITKTMAREVFVAWCDALGVAPGKAFTGRVTELGMYAAICQGRIKIGFSHGPTQRIRQLREPLGNGLLEAYRPVVVIAGADQMDEHAVHRVLRPFTPFNRGDWKCEFYQAGSPVGALVEAFASCPGAIVVPCPVGNVRTKARRRSPSPSSRSAA